jgi:hypothetical protein
MNDIYGKNFATLHDKAAAAVVMAAVVVQWM